MFRITILDKYLVKGFIGPFITAFFIAIFVLVMQFLWSFIDDIIGKGVGTFEILELVFYNSLSLFPLGLPIAVLLASVMQFGSLSEKYELSSFKSAGISLVRIMMPVAFCSLFAAGFSLYCSNTLIPLTNLKFYSRLYDIRNQKPALSIEEGVFNDDFKGFSIRVGHKFKDNKRIEDILIYDQSTSTRRKFNMIKAERGEMFISEDQRFFVMKLYDGEQYQEVERSGGAKALPFARTSFKTWTKYFDLSQFELGKTPEDYFKSHHKMKSVQELAGEIDSIDINLQSTRLNARNDFNNILDELNLSEEEELERMENDSLREATTKLTKSAKAIDERPLASAEIVEIERQDSSVQKRKPVRAIAKKMPIVTVLDTISPDSGWAAILAAFPTRSKRQFASQAEARVKSARSGITRTATRLNMFSKQRNEHVYELHTKFAFAMICVIFLFIGAPMGAIVRKGGYGYPLLVAIIFFTVFIILSLTFKKLMETGAVDPVFGAWAPCIVMSPIAAFLTYKALRDTKMLDIGKFFRKVAKLLKKDSAGAGVKVA
jgi:lipopolysaccharide export system permease protein